MSSSKKKKMKKNSEAAKPVSTKAAETEKTEAAKPVSTKAAENEKSVAEANKTKKPFFKAFWHKYTHNIPFAISFTIFVISFVVFVVLLTRDLVDESRMNDANDELADIIRNAELSSTPEPEYTDIPTTEPETNVSETPVPDTPVSDTPTPLVTDVPADQTPGPDDVLTPTAAPDATITPDASVTPKPTATPAFTATPTPSPTPRMSAGGSAAYKANSDYVGWLELMGDYAEGTYYINYPVFQTFDDPSTPYDPNDESTNEAWFYLNHDAKKRVNQNGSIFVEELCTVGTGTAENDYENGTKPSANIIIYGHNVVKHKMFGSLKQLWSNDYLEAHHTLAFTTRYEYREYEIISLFLDNIPEDTSTYYFGSFIECNSEEEFNTWYSFIKKKSVKKLDVTAKYGDEFLTLVTCSKDGVSSQRRVVVAVRVK